MTEEAPIILSFDVEEHHRIEAAAGLSCAPRAARGVRAAHGVLHALAARRLAALDIRATFFVVGEIARSHPDLLRALHRAGHEVGSHSWDHPRVHRLTPDEFREDVRKSQEAIEDVTGAAVAGYRALTFSVMRETAWAIDVLAELGLLYDSSIYPVRHDRYGVPDAPRTRSGCGARGRTLLEIPPATLRLGRMNVPVGGGGYFRLLPLFLMERAFAQVRRHCVPAVTMLYFHPWEFDPDQPRLPLGRVSRFRTYVGTKTSRGRLRTLLGRHRFARAVDVAAGIEAGAAELPTFPLAAPVH